MHTPDIFELHRALCGVKPVGQIDGHDVIRRESALDIVCVRMNAFESTHADLLAALKLAHRAIGGEYIPGVQSTISAAIAKAQG
jgi:hypothetical protein